MCVVIGCLLIDLVMLIDTMIVRFTSSATRGFSSRFFLSLVSSLHGEKNPWVSGTRVLFSGLFRMTIKIDQ